MCAREMLGEKVHGWKCGELVAVRSEAEGGGRDGGSRGARRKNRKLMRHGGRFRPQMTRMECVDALATVIQMQHKDKKEVETHCIY